MSAIIKLLSKFDDSGIKKAQKGFSGLKRTLGTIGIGFGLKAITDGLVNAAKAADADARSVRLLNSQLQKSTDATDKQLASTDKFVSALSMQVGIADDELRPALAGLARVTGSVTKAQDLLGLAVDGAATKGVPLRKVSEALAKAYAGQTTSLVRMFPELKKSKDVLGDYAKIVQGEAAKNASPFAKLTTSLGELEEKLGAVVLPLIQDFIKEMMKPGGAIDQVGKFLEDVSNPKTEAGQTFIEIKNAVKDVFNGVKDFFALFGDGNAMEGFKTIATNLIKALPALIALKGIMMLASAGKSIANLAKAIGLMTGANAVGGVDSPIAAIGKNKVMNVAIKAAVPLAVTFGALSAIDAEFTDPAKRAKLAENAKNKFSYYNPKMNKGIFVNSRGQDSSGNQIINIYNTAVDPKAAVDALSKYIKQNGRLPADLFWNKR